MHGKSHAVLYSSFLITSTIHMKISTEPVLMVYVLLCTEHQLYQLDLLISTTASVQMQKSLQKLKDLCQKKTSVTTLSHGKETERIWEADRSSVKLLKRLGSGQFGGHEVWEGVWNGATNVAVKSLKPGTVPRDKFLQDVDVMKKLRHPALVQLCAVCTKEEPFFIITELIAHGNLLDYLRGDGRSLKLQQLIDVCAQVAAGMAFLEEKKCIHRDLAARNILVAHGLKCKISTLSIYSVSDTGIHELAKGTKLPVKWMAPETLECYCFTIKSNVWSFGIIIYETITYGRFPYPGMTDPQVQEATRQGYRMPRSKGCPNKLYNIMMYTWREEPASRPTFETLQWQLEDFFSMDDESDRI